MTLHAQFGSQSSQRCRPADKVTTYAAATQTDGLWLERHTSSSEKSKASRQQS